MKVLGVFFLVVSTSWQAFAAPRPNKNSRTSPPKGALVVRAGTNSTEEYSTVNAALSALPNDGSEQSIFIYEGTYNEQVYITRPGKLTIYGYTTDTRTYVNNVVDIVASIPAREAGSNDASGTLRIHTDDFKLYNVNVRNNYGPGTQAVALSNYGVRAGLYGCGFYGFQDTLYASEGTHVYLKSYIEGAVDFIFGRLARSFFAGNTIAISSRGWVTASGRQADNEAVYVFDKNQIVLAASANSTAANNTYLGRPWGAYARVIFKNTYIKAPLNKGIWSIWNPGDERISNVYLADYHSFGPGAEDATRPSFVTTLNGTEAAKWNIGTAVGSDFANWVDLKYLV